MAPKASKRKAKEKTDEKSFPWTDELAKTLLLVCRDYQKKYGHDQQFSWVEVGQNFEAKNGGNECHHSVAKNKFDHMKKIWRLWTDLRYNATWIGWDPTTGRITADNEWWEKKIKENGNYRRFRKNGIEPEISELWDQVFGSIVASGRNVVSPSMDPSVKTEMAIVNVYDKNARITDLTLDEERVKGPVEEAIELSDSEEREKVADERVMDELHPENLRNLNIDGLTDADVLQSVHEILTSGGKSASLPTPTTGRSQKSLTESLGSKRPRKKAKSSAVVFTNHLERLEDRSEQFLSLFREEINSSSINNSGRKGYEHEDAMILLNMMVSEGLIEEEQELWCFAISELRKEESRHAFINVYKNSGRLAWLKYEMTCQRAGMGGK